MIAHYKLAIEKLRRALFGQRSERGERLLGQMELQLEELEATATKDALAAETADGTTVRSFTRRKTGRKPFPEHLPRERIVVPGPDGLRLQRLGPAGQDRRGHQRDAEGRAPGVEGDPTSWPAAGPAPTCWR
jgi:transposase